MKAIFEYRIQFTGHMHLIKKYFLILSFITALDASEVFAYSAQESTETSIHASFNALLKKYADDNGLVDYIGLAKEKQLLDKYIASLGQQMPDDKNTTTDYRLAYWINLYNASTLQLILEHYPIKSIMEINNGKAWSLKFIKVEENTFSLDHIEHSIIRKNFNDPRIHFAVNCAANSCPRLLNEAFDEKKLNIQLDNQAKRFINDNQMNVLSETKLKLSKIFEWYGDDFRKESTLVNYLNKYCVIEINPKVKIAFKEYDWKLNNQ